MIVACILEAVEQLDIREKGGVRSGVQQTSDKRLFMQLLAFGGVHNTAEVAARLEASGLPGVLYEDANDPEGIAVLTWSDDPNHFVDAVRPVLKGLTLKPEYTMMGRTYALGHEPNLEDWLMHRSPRSVTSPEWKWHVWYPLRRKGEFNALLPEDQTCHFHSGDVTDRGDRCISQSSRFGSWPSA